MLLELCILPTLRVVMCIKTVVGHVMRLKRLITVLFKRSEPFHLLRMMGYDVRLDSLSVLVPTANLLYLGVGYILSVSQYALAIMI